MFGIIYAGVVAITNVIGHTQEYFDDLDGKKRGIQRRNRGENLENVYFDHRGRLRDIATNELRDIRMQNGDWVLKDNNRNILRNLSEEKREAEYQKKKQEAPSGTKAIFYKSWNINDTPLKKSGYRITGDVYRDINTDKLYLLRYICWDRDDLSDKQIVKYENGKSWVNTYAAHFYLDTETAEIVDISDKSKEQLSDIELENAKKFIKHFNNEQRKGGWKLLAKEYGSVNAFYLNS